MLSLRHPVQARAVDLCREPHAREIQVHSPAEMHPFSEALALWMRVLGYSPKDLFAVWVALEEAVVNAFLHGNHGDSGKRIFVRYLVTPDEVLLEVEDQDHGFDPDRVPDPKRVAASGLRTRGSAFRAIHYYPRASGAPAKVVPHAVARQR